MRKNSLFCLFLITFFGCISYQAKTTPSFYDLRDKFQGTVGCYVSNEFTNYQHKGPGWITTPGINAKDIMLQGINAIAQNSIIVDKPTPDKIPKDYLFTIAPSFRSSAWDELTRNWRVEVQFDVVDSNGTLLDSILVSSNEDVGLFGSIAPDWGMNKIYQDGMAMIARSQKLQKTPKSKMFLAATETHPTNLSKSENYYSNVSVVDGQRTALVIGNGNYPNAYLRNPVNDAQDIAIVLRRAGFNVILCTDASLRSMEKAVNEFYTMIMDAPGIGFFYYAGHGIQLNGSNYLVPVDATLINENDTKYYCLDAGIILGKMEDAQNGANVVVLDACRNNPFAASFRSVSRGLAKIDAPTGSLLAYATAPGGVAADGLGRNGTYTKYLLKHIETPKITIEEVLKRVRVDVIAETNGKQTPWESSSLTGYLYIGR